MVKEFNLPNWVDQEKLDEIVATLRKAAMVPVNTIGRALNTPNIDLTEDEASIDANLLPLLKK